MKILLLIALIGMMVARAMAQMPAEAGFFTQSQTGGATCNTTLQAFGTDSAWESLGNGTAPWLASSNRWTTSTATCQVKVWLQKVGSPTGNITAYIYSEGSSVPGSVLATSGTTIVASSLTTSEASYLFSFSFTPSSGTTYWVALNNSVSDASNYVQVRMDGASSGGAIFQSANGTSWGSYDGTRGFFMSAMGSP